MRTTNFLLFFLLFLTSCILSKSDPKESSFEAVSVFSSGDIIVINSGNDTIIAMDATGNYQGIVYDSPTDATLLLAGLAWDSLTSKIIFAYDSTTAALDKIMNIDPVDGEVGTVISNGNLNGVLAGVARLTTGSLAILEGTTSIELFTSAGVRTGNPFLATVTATAAGIFPLPAGGFVTCSSGVAATVRTYNAAGVVVSTATSALPLPTLGALAASDCIVDSSGRIIVAYSGATDHVRVYNSTLATIDWTFNDPNILSSPGKMALKANGNILVTDTVFNHIVEISPDGGYVGTLGGGVLSTPTSVLVIP